MSVGISLKLCTEGPIGTSAHGGTQREKAQKDALR